MSFYEAERKLWFEACDAISKSDVGPEGKRRAFEWLKELLIDPRPYPSVRDFVYSELFGEDVYFGHIEGSPFDVIWGINDDDRIVSIFQIGTDLDPLAP